MYQNSEAERQFRGLTEALPQLVWTSLPDGTGPYFNSQWTDYTGLSSDKLGSHGWKQCLHPDDRERIYATWLAGLESKKPYDMECQILRTDGVYHWFKAQAVPMRDAGGKIVRWFGICTDIDEQKRVEMELQRLSHELEKRIEERTANLRELIQDLEAFSYGVSHNLRSPLRAMLGFATLAREQLDDHPNPKLKDYLDRIIAGATRADRLIQDVLTCSRVGRGQLRLESVRLDKLLRETIEQFPEFQPPNANVRIQSPLHHVRAHEATLGQCLANMLSNAVKFVRKGTVPRVRVWTEEMNDDVRIWIQDNGIGIDPADQGRIFGIFERVHSNSDYEGTGVGLAVARRGVERMGGSIGVESKLGHGSRFFIQLKRARNEQH